MTKLYKLIIFIKPKTENGIYWQLPKKELYKKVYFIRELYHDPPGNYIL